MSYFLQGCIKELKAGMMMLLQYEIKNVEDSLRIIIYLWFYLFKEEMHGYLCVIED